MTITCQPMDATAGSPAYSAQNERQALAALFGGGGGVALAARSGWRPGVPSNLLTATSTTWTLLPWPAIISPNAATVQGSYRWSTDANITGAMRAANATYARKDIVYIQVNDSSSGDGSGALSAPPLYAYGPEDGTNVPPALPARSFLVGTISVPIAGGGSPTVVVNPAVFVAAGAAQPVFTQAERDALTAYDGLTVRRMDVAGRPTETYNGTAWLPGGIKHAEYLRVGQNDAPANTLWGMGPMGGYLDTSGSPSISQNYTGLFDYPANDQIRVLAEGIYSLIWKLVPVSATATFYLQAADSGGTVLLGKVPPVSVAANDSLFMTAPNMHLRANDVINLKYSCGTAAVSVNHRVKITKVS